MSSCEKLGIILVITQFQKMMLSKNVNNKKYAPKLNTNEKEIRMITMIFKVEN